jgi:hypothetical protein
MSNTESTQMTSCLESLADALRSGAPIVAILGQVAGWAQNSIDPVLLLALEKAGRSGGGWGDLLSRAALDSNLYDWIAERFARRVPPDALSAIADIPLSAVFTSSIDPGLPNLLSTNGREPEPILIGNPVPTTLRSTRRPPIFYLFGRAGAGTPELDPPTSRQALSQRRLQHAAGMLLLVKESATALGLIVVDGYNANTDWLRAEELLAAIAEAPKGRVAWFGEDPVFNEEDFETFQELISSGVILRDDRPLGEAYTYLRAADEVSLPRKWDEPEIITLQTGGNFVVSPRLRLLTEATASIVDNSWTGFLPPFSNELDAAAFQSFHSANLGERALVEGIRRGYSFQRDFEEDLYSKTEKALAKHHEQTGAIILHGQSGVGKSIALARLAIRTRENVQVAVLMVTGSRIPQASEISPFLEAIGRVGSVTLLLVDANGPVKRYDELLSALRSGGNKVVVVGSSYKIEGWRKQFVAAPASLSPREVLALAEISKGHSTADKSFDGQTDHALAKFYWSLPESRGGIADGISREARAVETALRLKEKRPRANGGPSALAAALVTAGYAKSFGRVLPTDLPDADITLDSPAAKAIDYVMAVSRLYKAVPINLLMRTILAAPDEGCTSIDVETLRDLFEGEDFFRWQRGGRDESELLISSRLQIEAELVCNRRLGTPAAEALRIMELISNAYRAGPQDSEESHFVSDIVYALGEDGPAGDRYKDAYLQIARGLSTLREKQGVKNARLMLQESALRRAYLRLHEIEPEAKAVVLDEAIRAVNDALTAIELSGSNRLYAGKRTHENLLTERAATYGFLALDSSQRAESASVVWASYRVARDAARRASGRVLSYMPLDISLWVPIRLLRASAQLSEAQRAELQADIRSTLDIVDPTALPPDQFIYFNRQQLAAGDVLNDSELSEEAFLALDAAGSAVGYYLKARAMAPTRPKHGEIASGEEVHAAEKAAAYLTNVFPKISHDSRSMRLLIAMEWIKATGHWMFRGLRQPLPFESGIRDKICSLVAELKAGDEESFSPQFRYIDAVLRWLDGEQKVALRSWRMLAQDTEFVEARRVANRHTITDTNGKPIIYSGVVVKSIGPGRWSVKIQSIDREVDLQENDFPDTEIAVGRTVPKLAVSFNYRGPIADAFYLQGH